MQHCHTDNGVFKSQAFAEELTKHCQTLTLSSVGTPHQNRVTEHTIGVIQQMAHVMMLYARGSCHH